MSDNASMIEPSGNPTGVLNGSSRLSSAENVVGDTGRYLMQSSHDSAMVWSGKAQMIFALLATGVGRLMTGTSEIASEFSQEMARYAAVLERCQREVQIARQRLDTVDATDIASVALCVKQANNATAEAEAAAQRLSSVALKLMGNTNGGIDMKISGDADTSFVSQAHSASCSLVTGTGPGPAFDAKAGQVEAQFVSILGALVPGAAKSVAVLLADSSSAAAGPSALLIGPAASNVSGSIMIKPGSGLGAGTVLLGQQGPLTTAPGIAVLTSGASPPPTHVTFLPAYFDTTDAILLSGPSPDAQAKIAEYEAYVNSPAYQANLERSSGAEYEGVNIGLIGNAIRDSQDWTAKYQEAWHETFQGVDYNYDGHVGL